MQRYLQYDSLKAALAEKRIALFAPKDVEVSCCGGCMGGSVESAIAASRTPTYGAVFWHDQDHEGALEGDGFYFRYGAYEYIPLAVTTSLEVGQTLCKVLTTLGYGWKWEGDPGSCIYVYATPDEDLGSEPKCDECGFSESRCQCCSSCGYYTCQCEEEEDDDGS